MRLIGLCNTFRRAESGLPAAGGVRTSGATAAGLSGEQIASIVGSEGGSVKIPERKEGQNV